jgi:tetratricopeptide (TPR) repeat protein
MKAKLFVFLLGGCAWAGGQAAAQTNAPAPNSAAPVSPAAPTAVTPSVTAPAPAPAAPLDPAKIAEYQKRFAQGYELEKEGKLADALAIYEGILAEQPNAKRSLLEAGRICLELNEPAKADAYLDTLHTIVPEFPEAMELLIQANETLKHDVKVERLIREFRALRDSGKVPGFSDSLFFEREHIRLDDGSEIVFTEFFDYTKPPYYTLKAEMFGPEPDHESKRVLLLKYDPDGTQAVRAKDPKMAHDEVFILAEPFFSGGKINRIDVYQELLSTPEYNKARSMMLLIMAHPPKAIYSAPVDEPAQ